MHGDDLCGRRSEGTDRHTERLRLRGARRWADGLNVEKRLMKPGLNMNSLGNNPDGLTPNDRSRCERAITVVMRWRGQ